MLLRCFLSRGLGFVCGLLLLFAAQSVVASAALVPVVNSADGVFLLRSAEDDAQVRAGDAIAVLVVDGRATVVPSSVSGKLMEHASFSKGDVVSTGDILAFVSPDDSAASATPAPAADGGAEAHDLYASGGSSEVLVRSSASGRFVAWMLEEGQSQDEKLPVDAGDVIAVLASESAEGGPVFVKSPSSGVVTRRATLLQGDMVLEDQAVAVLDVATADIVEAEEEEEEKKEAAEESSEDTQAETFEEEEEEEERSRESESNGGSGSNPLMAALTVLLLIVDLALLVVVGVGLWWACTAPPRSSVQRDAMLDDSRDDIA
mmetsp:Transcript_185/g.277  ORF Transcript_185/g.277 Transcript_185/m.277 type:complete len:318 (-) Transcript_185:89-1042(-)|eukprot:CAMPEP_0178412270 /NCGR_PEP_ID=MMETSP0689_2-20121128/21931_1 /TAXON_ID=160604 /ORGANISM="Amphidinium massartii, Strain CS-259" /LENGTH=317 /DNA_ID=CAMNT_0020033517 /DNA_START=97 /DNA_END=1050 /DNA_ORIENTATION=+